MGILKGDVGIEGGMWALKEARDVGIEGEKWVLKEGCGY